MSGWPVLQPSTHGFPLFGLLLTDFPRSGVSHGRSPKTLAINPSSLSSFDRLSHHSLSFALECPSIDYQFKGHSRHGLGTKVFSQDFPNFRYGESFFPSCFAVEVSDSMTWTRDAVFRFTLWYASVVFFIAIANSGLGCNYPPAADSFRPRKSEVNALCSVKPRPTRPYSMNFTKFIPDFLQGCSKIVSTH